MPGGQTSHSTFKIPIDIHAASTYSISKQSDNPVAILMKRASPIIIDEAYMLHGMPSQHCIAHYVISNIVKMFHLVVSQFFWLVTSDRYFHFYDMAPEWRQWKRTYSTVTCGIDIKWYRWRNKHASKSESCMDMQTFQYVLEMVKTCVSCTRTRSY